MPFQSERQRRYLWMFHPDIAKRWTAEYGTQIRVKPKRKRRVKRPRK